MIIVTKLRAQTTVRQQIQKWTQPGAFIPLYNIVVAGHYVNIARLPNLYFIGQFTQNIVVMLVRIMPWIKRRTGKIPNPFFLLNQCFYICIYGQMLYTRNLYGKNAVFAQHVIEIRDQRFVIRHPL